MSFAVIGVNHRNCPIEIREKVSFTHNRVLTSMLRLREEYGIREVIMLSTCNRSEIYIEDEKIEEAIKKVIHFYESYFTDKEITPYLFISQGEAAIKHLFQVAAGLDSIVVGEDQILGQVKKAHSDAMSEHTSGKVLNKIFREAISTAKQIKSEMKISEYPLSISRIAVKFLKEKQGSLEGKRALVIGTGQMNELTIKYLLEEHIGDIYVTNRTHTKAVALTESYEGLIAVPYEARYEILSKVDIVLSATASPHIILQREKMPEITQRIDIMDIAMPRDIDTSINDMAKVNVYDIDALKNIAEANNTRRLEIAREAEEKIEEAMTKLTKWLRALNVEDVIQGIDTYCKGVEEHTIKSLSKKVSSEPVDESLLSMVMEEALKRCMRAPIAKLMTTEDEAQRAEYARVLTELFELN